MPKEIKFTPSTYKGRPDAPTRKITISFRLHNEAAALFQTFFDDASSRWWEDFEEQLSAHLKEVMINMLTIPRETVDGKVYVEVQSE